MSERNTQALAIELEVLLTRYSQSDREVSQLAGSLSDLIDQAKSSKLKLPVKNVPGNYWFTEGNLSQYPDLESAFAKFKLSIQASDEVALRDLKEWAQSIKDGMFKK